MENENYLLDTSGEDSALLAPQRNDLAYVNPSEIPDLDKAEVGFSLEAKYLKFETKGQTVRCVFNGFTTIRKNEGGEVRPMTAAVLQNKEGLFLNSTSNILDQLTRIPVGTAVQISYTGDEKTASGYNVKKFDIRVLNVKVASTTIAHPAPAVEVVKPAADKKSDVDAFWSKVYEMGLTNIDGQQILKENNNDFGKAYGVLIGNQF